MTLPRHFILAAVICVVAPAAAMIGAGCASKPEKPARDYEFPATQPAFNPQGNAVYSTQRNQQWESHPLAAPQKATPVTEGPSPLVYIFDLGGPLRVVDLTSNVAIATAVAP